MFVKLFQNVQLEIDLKPDLPRSVQTEPDWLLDILLNLLENAYRFTREGTVTLQVSYDAGKGRVVYKVMDTGPGVPEEERQYMFHPFFQGRAGQLSRRGNGAFTLEDVCGVRRAVCGGRSAHDAVLCVCVVGEQGWACGACT